MQKTDPTGFCKEQCEHGMGSSSWAELGLDNLNPHSLQKIDPTLFCKVHFGHGIGVSITSEGETKLNAFWNNDCRLALPRNLTVYALQPPR